MYPDQRKAQEFNAAAPLIGEGEGCGVLSKNGCKTTGYDSATTTTPATAIAATDVHLLRIRSGLTSGISTSVPLMLISGPDVVEHRVYLADDELTALADTITLPS